MWGIKIVATKRPGHSTLRQHILNNQLEENGSNVQNGQNGHFSIFAFFVFFSPGMTLYLRIMSSLCAVPLPRCAAAAAAAKP